MGYYDSSGNIRSELLDKEAGERAKEFVRVSRQDKPLTSAQLRRFFGEFRSLEKKVNLAGFEKVKPLIKMVKSKASYAANPNNRKIPDTFKEFLISNVDQINDEKDFKAFMLHFEAVVGFCYGLGMRNN